MIDALSSCPVCLKLTLPIEPQPMRDKRGGRREYSDVCWVFHCCRPWTAKRSETEEHFVFCVRAGLYAPQDGVREREAGTSYSLLPLRRADSAGQRRRRVHPVPDQRVSTRVRSSGSRRRAGAHANA